MGADDEKELSAFEQAAGHTEYPYRVLMLFNNGRTAFELGRPEGETLLREYVLWDRESGWAQEAQALLGIGPEG